MFRPLRILLLTVTRVNCNKKDYTCGGSITHLTIQEHSFNLNFILTFIILIQFDYVIQVFNLS
jgi:hypothetical protein